MKQFTKILIVEDELLIARNIAAKLKKVNYQISNIVTSGEAAIQSISEDQPDLILMDIAIKGDLDGIETANRVKSHNDIPIIFLTAYADDRTLERASETGCYGYLVKPFQERELYATIKMALSKHREQSTIQNSLQAALNEYSSQYNNIYRDNVTNLPNQLFLRDLFDYLVSSLRETTSQDSNSEVTTSKLIAIFYLHLDRFEKINESLENDWIDTLLKTVAERLTKCVNNFDRGGATVHLEQNEFAVMVTIANRQIATNLGTEILTALNQPIILDNRELFLSVSIGVAFYPFDNDEIEELVQQAKQAMKYAQQQGGNRCQWFTLALNLGVAKASESLTLETELHHALERQELEIYYQPKVNIEGKIVGAEALLRWNHSEMGLISPDRFLPLAEETGLILPIGEWVLKRVCRQTKFWHDNGLDFLKVGVNLSGVQFKQSDLFHRITQILFDSAIEPQFLELELTEKILVENIKTNVRRLNLLKKLGITIALDDFGTGYSSLGYLQQFPFDILKIDRCFINKIDRNSTNAVITQTIIEMAHRLGLKVVAEGVETQAELDFLKRSQCDEIQGYLVSRPLPTIEFEKLIVNNVKRYKDLLKVQGESI